MSKVKDEVRSAANQARAAATTFGQTQSEGPVAGDVVCERASEPPHRVRDRELWAAEDGQPIGGRPVVRGRRQHAHVMDVGSEAAGQSQQVRARPHAAYRLLHQPTLAIDAHGHGRRARGGNHHLPVDHGGRACGEPRPHRSAATRARPGGEARCRARRSRGRLPPSAVTARADGGSTVNASATARPDAYRSRPSSRYGYAPLSHSTGVTAPAAETRITPPALRA